LFNDAVGIVTALLVIEGGILFLSQARYSRVVFKYLPSMFWIYFLPMLANTFGLIPRESATYDHIRNYCLPASLVLLLISVDILAIAKLGKVALAVMLAGTAGILLGGPIVYLIFKSHLPSDFWMGFGALSASWTGGSANMIAVKEGLKAPDAVFLPMVVVDTICPYMWMGLLILLAGYQKPLDRLLKADSSIVEHLTRQANSTQRLESPLTLEHIAGMLALAAAATFVSIRLANQLPVVKNMFNASSWTIIVVTGLAIALSFTPLRRLENYGASKLGYALLYFVLASIGAKTSLTHLASAPLLIVAGFIWIAIHGVFILAAGRLLRAPMSLMAAASQANIGGTASAPVVAVVYQMGLAPVGLLLAVLGNIIGTYAGFLCSHLCHFVEKW